MLAQFRSQTKTLHARKHEASSLYKILLLIWFAYRILFTVWHLWRNQKVEYTNTFECIQIIFHSLGLIYHSLWHR